MTTVTLTRIVCTFCVAIGVTACSGEPTDQVGLSDIRNNQAKCVAGDPDGKPCVGWTDSEKRGWAGFCIAETCTEYVHVRCHITTPTDQVIVGCDGSGAVTNGYAIEVESFGKIYHCRGTEGEFGYCNSGDACAVTTPEYQGPMLIAEGTCE